MVYHAHIYTSWSTLAQTAWCQGSRDKTLIITNMHAYLEHAHTLATWAHAHPYTDHYWHTSKQVPNKLEHSLTSNLIPLLNSRLLRPLESSTSKICSNGTYPISCMNKITLGCKEFAATKVMKTNDGYRQLLSLSSVHYKLKKGSKNRTEI